MKFTHLDIDAPQSISIAAEQFFSQCSGILACITLDLAT